MGDPALVLRPELPRAVEATHAEDGGRQVEDPSIVEDVLVRGALRATVGTIELERLFLVDTEPQGRVGWLVSRIRLDEVLVAVQLAVDLVRRGTDQRRRVG